MSPARVTVAAIPRARDLRPVGTGRPRVIPRILVIAGSDSGGGAGVQADVRTIAMLGGHATTAITALTAQNTLGVQRVMPVPADMVLAQIESVASDIGVDAVKIGMLGSAAVAHAVADWLDAAPDVPVVFDPAMVATSGAALADPATVAAFERLLRRATLVTPNLPELEALGGEAPVRARTAALLVKGGHRDGDEVVDRLETAAGTWTFRNPRIATRGTHGTGCTLASAIATGIAAGLPLDRAVEQGIALVRAALAAAPGLGGGHGPMGHALGLVPFHHLLAATGTEGRSAAEIAAGWGYDA